MDYFSNPLQMMSQFGAGQQKLQETRNHFMSLKIKEKFYIYFNITSELLLKRLQLLFFPFYKFMDRQQFLNLDMYIPLMGHLLYITISCYLQAFNSPTFNTKHISRTVGLCAILFIIHNGGTYLLSKTVLSEQTIMQHVAESGYNFIYAATAILFKRFKVIYYPVIVYMLVCAGFHRAHMDIVDVKRNADKELSSQAAIKVKYSFCICFGIAQAVVLFFYILLG